MPSQLITRLAAVTGMALCLGLGASDAHAGFGFESFGGAATGPDGTFSRQAGGHADLTTTINFNQTDAPPGERLPDEAVRDIEVALPPGVTGNPTAAPTCEVSLLLDSERFCPPETQIGRVIASTQGLPGGFPGSASLNEPLYNLARPAGAPGLFGFRYAGTLITITPKVRPGDYGVSAVSAGITQALPLYGMQVTIWSVPADPVHTPERGPYGWDESKDSRKSFLTNSTSCPEAALVTRAKADSWENPGVWATAEFDRDFDGTPFVMEGCEQLPFRPSMAIAPTSRVADAPTGLAVDLAVPQNDGPDALATAHVRKVKVTLPVGMSVSPSSAAGLGACSSAQIALLSADDPTCPSSAKIGSVDIDTPLLDEPLQGDVILAAPDDNPFSSLLAIYVVAKGPGFTLKLPGRIEADEVTGQLTTTFDNNPQLPFSNLRLRFRGGSQAPLANPPGCGTYNVHTEITSWASDEPVSQDNAFTIDEGCEPRIFAPVVTAGSLNPLAGASSPFSLTITRADRTQNLSRITTTLPPGLLAKIASVPRCPEAQAAAGTCSDASLVGNTTVLSGPGAAPLSVTGKVFLTGPYGKAPFGLSIAVPTAGQAGPYDLGSVVVRAGITVDRTTARATVTSDPLPTMLRGFPLRVRQVNVMMDRPGFMLNPTSCGTSTIDTTLGSVEGTTLAVAPKFQAVGCNGLELQQKLQLTFAGTGQNTPHKHPGLSAKLTAVDGVTNLRKVEVKLPLSVALDPKNARALCEPAQRAALACPAESIIGQATAKSILPSPLTGPVYFVKGTRITKSGKVAASLPKLWIPLSGDGVTIDVDASSDVDSLNRLVSTFDSLPDAPISSFEMRLAGGSHGILTVTPGKGGLCGRDSNVDVRLTGQNSISKRLRTRAAVEGCKLQIGSKSVSRTRVAVRAIGIGAGKLTLRGPGIRTSSRTIRGATTTNAALSAALTKKARTTAARSRRGMRTAVTLRFSPKKGKATTVKTTVVVKPAKKK